MASGRTQTHPLPQAVPQDLPPQLVSHRNDLFSIGSVNEPRKDNMFIFHPQSTQVTQTSVQSTVQIYVSFVFCGAPKKTASASSASHLTEK